MTEVHGRFVWQEDHDRVVDEVRRQAFAEGYAAGHRDAVSEQQLPVHLVLHQRRGPLHRVKLALLAVAVVCLALALPVLVFTP